MDCTRFASGKRGCQHNQPICFTLCILALFLGEWRTGRRWEQDSRCHLVSPARPGRLCRFQREFGPNSRTDREVESVDVCGFRLIRRKSASMLNLAMEPRLCRDVVVARCVDDDNVSAGLCLLEGVVCSETEVTDARLGRNRSGNCQGSASPAAGCLGVCPCLGRFEF